MKKEYVAITCIIFVIVLIGSFWTASNYYNTKTWTKLASWNTMINNIYVDTDCNFTTNQYKITGEQWRISWSTGGQNPLGSRFDIKIYSDEVGTTLFKEIITSTNESDPTYTGYGQDVITLQGNVHLQVFIVGGLPHWTFMIEEYK